MGFDIGCHRAKRREVTDIVDQDAGEIGGLVFNVLDHLRQRVASLDIQAAFALVRIDPDDFQSAALGVLLDDILLVAGGVPACQPAALRTGAPQNNCRQGHYRWRSRFAGWWVILAVATRLTRLAGWVILNPLQPGICERWLDPGPVPAQSAASTSPAGAA